MITVFLDAHADARGSAPLSSLWIYADASQSTSITLQFPKGTPLDDQARAAESLLSGVKRWRDDLVARAEEERTAANELAEARAEIERLKSEAGEPA